MKEHKKSRILSNLFRNVIISMVLVELANVGCGFVDGVIISRFLGSNAMAAQGIVYPYFSMIGIVSGMLATGMQSLCTTYMGEGNKKEMNSVFSQTCIVAGIFSFFIAIMIFLFTKQICNALLGSEGSVELLNNTQSYLIGLACGTPALMFVAILTPIVHLDGSKILARVAAIVLFVSDIIGDLLVALMDGGILGMGLVTSISNYIGLTVLLIHFFSKHCTVHFSFSRLHLLELLNILKIGLPKATKRLANMLRPLCLNALVLSYGTVRAMSAMSVRNNLNNMMDIVGSGLVSASFLIISILYGEKNRSGIHQITRQAVNYTLFGVGGLSILVIVFAPLIANFYVDEPEVYAMSVTAIRCMALNLPLNTLTELCISFFQGTKRENSVHILNFCSRFMYVVICAFVMGKLWGINGIWAAFPVSSLLLFITIAFVCHIKNRKFQPSFSAVFSLPNEFGERTENSMECSINMMSEVREASVQAIDFCKVHGIDNRRSYLIGLFIEEMAGSIVEHGFCKDRKKHTVDLRFYLSEGKLTLRLRDDCPLFDVKERGERLRPNPEDPTANIGIRIVMGMSNELTYISTLGTNNLIVTV